MYDELVNALRRLSDWSIMDFEDNLSYANQIAEQAADAIEELVRKEKFHAFLWNTIQPNEMEQYISMYNSRNIPQKPPKEE